MFDAEKRNREPLNDSLSLLIFDDLRGVTGTLPNSPTPFDKEPKKKSPAEISLRRAFQHILAVTDI